MGGVCGVAVESDAVRISYFRDGQRVEDSIDAEGARWHLNGKLVDCGPFGDVVLTGRDSDAVESLLATLDTGNGGAIRMVDEGAALLAYARSVDVLADARALLVLDFGRHGTSAFTLDVADSRVVRSLRRSAMSGEALDDVVERLVMEKKILPPAQGFEAQREYRSFFRELKELVTNSVGVRAPGEGPMLLTRDEFENAITPVLLQTLAWAAPNVPDAVLLIGGGAQIPVVGRLVEQQWPVPLVLPESPSSVILHGAALEATPSPPKRIEVALDEVVFEAATTPMRVVAPVVEPEPVALVVEPEPVVEPVPTSQQAPSRRRLRWSIRDAAALAGVAAVVLLVWAVVFLRGDTPPAPGIGVEPAGTAPRATSVAEGVPPAPAPAPVPPAPVLPDPAPEGFFSEPVVIEDNEFVPTAAPESVEEPFEGFDSGFETGPDVGN